MARRLLLVVGLLLLAARPAEAAGPILADRVAETTTTAGAGALTLAGATTNHVAFATAIGVGNTTYYAIVHRTEAQWEVGLGTLSGSTTLARTTIYATWNGTNHCTSSCTALEFFAGTKDVFVTAPAGPLGAIVRGTIRSCVVAIGDPGAGSPALADDNNSPAVCPNDFGVDWTITGVACYANTSTGAPTATVAFTGGASILTGAIACGNAVYAAGTLSGTPVVHTFSGAGATCASTPCSLGISIAPGGTAKYIIVKITGTI